MIWINGPSIGKLCGHTRKWAHENLQRGSFGQIKRGPGGAIYATLAGVERFMGRAFSEANIAFAVDGRTGRIMQIEEPANGFQDQV